MKVDDQFKKYRVSDALMIIYRLFWDDFSSWYLEVVKPAYQQPVDRATYEATMGFIDQLMRMLHPFMPFITEEIWQLISRREQGESLMVSAMPEPESYDRKRRKHFEELKEVVTAIRSIRKEKNMAPKESLALMVRIAEGSKYRKHLEPVIMKLANISDVSQVPDGPDGAASFIVRNVEYFVPVGDMVDAEAELKKLQEELDYTRGFLLSVEKKLGNERFVQHAPEAVVNKERQKMDDARGKIAVLETQIARLKG
jgi:valyl-tRNA synthetase